jgi:putative flippase GtrA
VIISLALRYGAFAVIAILVNLAVQRVVLGYGGGLLAAMAAGTVLGLVVKYILDKRWIFADDSTGLRAHGRRFTLYAGMGVLTTLLFWAIETGFWWIGQTHTARELGAVVGLTLGYLLKYELDRRYVFTSATGAP